MAENTINIVGDKEDVVDAISNIAVNLNTPVVNSFGEDKITGLKKEWQTDSLLAASEDGAIEGADAPAASFEPTVMLDNLPQTVTRTAKVTGAVEATDAYGRQSELDLQVFKKVKELQHSKELIVTSYSGKIQGDAVTIANKTAGLGAFNNTNIDAAGDATEGTSDGNTTRVGGTLRTFVRGQIDTVQQAAVTKGGMPSKLFMPADLFGKFATFTAGEQKNIDAKEKTIVSAVTVYYGQFGNLVAQYSNFMPANNVQVLDTDLCKVAYKRKMTETDLPSNGDSMSKFLLEEYAFVCKNPAGIGAVYDVEV